MTVQGVKFEVGAVVTEAAPWEIFIDATGMHAVELVVSVENLGVAQNAVERVEYRTEMQGFKGECSASTRAFEGKCGEPFRRAVLLEAPSLASGCTLRVMRGKDSAAILRVASYTLIPLLAANPFEMATREWIRGCSCAPAGKPWACEACTKGLYDHVLTLLTPEQKGELTAEQNSRGAPT